MAAIHFTSVVIDARLPPYLPWMGLLAVVVVVALVRINRPKSKK